MTPLTPTELWTEHQGRGYLAPALNASGETLPAGFPGALSRAAAADVNVRPQSSMTEGSAAAPPPGPGRRSLTTAQLAESARIAYMCAHHRFKRGQL